MRFDDRLDPLLEEIAQRIRTCTKCPLAEGRTNTVPGEGPQHATMMFVGEAPGSAEDESGRPFVGQSGKLLTETMASVGIERENVFITNVVKCRPHDNRDPQEKEIGACAPYVLSQMDSISPIVLVTLGNISYDFFSTTFYLPKKQVGEVRGKVFRLHSTACKYLIPTYHPAAVIYNRKLLPDFKEDLKKAERYLKVQW
ncbi:MAG: uracil-DNA glycosylase family protein [Thermoplasmatota archaeon]